MTRINVVPVSELHDKHLLAEYRELPRVFGAARIWLSKGGKPESLPQTYHLGKGHVLFFYNRLDFCALRAGSLYQECLQRGFKPRFSFASTVDLWLASPGILCNDYIPTGEALRINRQRIKERLISMGTYSDD